MSSSRLSAKETTQTRVKLNSWLRGLSRRRSTGVVTSDDAHTFLDRQGISQRQVKTRLSFINSVLRQPNFTTVGETPSVRPVAKGRTISEWMVA